MISKQICVAPTGDRCGEGAVWHETHAAIYWTDINRFLIHRFTPSDQCVRTWFFDEPVTALTLTNRDDVLTVVLGSQVILWEPASDTRHKHGFYLEGWPKVRLNDGRADPRGSLWVGSMRNNVNADGSSGEAGGKEGILYRLDPNGPVTTWRRDVGISNTLAWSPDGQRFYFGDTSANTLWAYDYDPATGDRANETHFFRISHAACLTARR
jgi:sugar lactone lactonase YvrE